ncbi:MAG: thymidine kinase [Candidatus Calescibacterium sp.]|nr:thymidine kinase [Candidatus Calescibacterium sp.]MCX7971783.1 thymidine kinase [bacterium]MDW8195389.1 thymidine kinase [Candidatus Calescibacterium sp.]
MTKYEGGWIELIVGCMFSGKSEEMIRRVKRAIIANQKVIVFKPAIDKRYDKDMVVSHNGIKLKAVVVENPEQIYTMSRDYNVIAIDEAQFFDKTLIEVVEKLAEENKRIIIAGLDQDFRGEPFSIMPHLMAIADTVDKLHAICVVCGAVATKSQRLIEGKPAPYDSPTIVVGAIETYQPRCRKCFQKPTKTKVYPS